MMGPSNFFFVVAMQNVSRFSLTNNTPSNRSRRPRLLYGDGNSSPNSSQQQSFSTNETNKGLGISNTNGNTNNVLSTGGIRSGMASLGLTPSAGGGSLTNNNNENSSSSTDRSNTGGVGGSHSNNNSNSTNNSSSNTSNNANARMAARRSRRV